MAPRLHKRMPATISHTACDLGRDAFCLCNRQHIETVDYGMYITMPTQQCNLPHCHVRCARALTLTLVQGKESNKRWRRLRRVRESRSTLRDTLKWRSNVCTARGVLWEWSAGGGGSAKNIVPKKNRQDFSWNISNGSRYPNTSLKMDICSNF